MNHFRRFLLKHFEVQGLSIAFPGDTDRLPWPANDLVLVTGHRDGITADMPIDKLWSRYVQETQGG